MKNEIMKITSAKQRDSIVRDLKLERSKLFGEFNGDRYDPEFLAREAVILTEIEKLNDLVF